MNAKLPSSLALHNDLSVSVDHTELDIRLKDGRGQSEKPRLTIILDDYSGPVAGYASPRPEVR